MELRALSSKEWRCDFSRDLSVWDLSLYVEGNWKYRRRKGEVSQGVFCEIVSVFWMSSP